MPFGPRLRMDAGVREGWVRETDSGAGGNGMKTASRGESVLLAGVRARHQE